MGWKYKFNEDIFTDLNKEEDAYWLGFLYADGTTSKYSTRIGLAPRDINHIQKFRTFISGNMPIRKYKVSCNIDVNSMVLATRLKQLGIVVARGRFDLTLAKLPQSSHRHFIRGYVDGDGCLAKDERVIILGKLDILEWIQNVFINTLGINKTKLRHRGNVHELCVGGRKQAWTVVDFLYQDAVVLLDRKLKKTEGWKRSTYKPTNKYRGVHFFKRTGRWMVQIKHKGKEIYLGYYDDEIEAALVYDEAAKKYHGDKAYLNFPDK